MEGALPSNGFDGLARHVDRHEDALVVQPFRAERLRANGGTLSI